MKKVKKVKKVNKLAKLRRHASKVHFAKIHFGKMHFGSKKLGDGFDILGDGGDLLGDSGKIGGKKYDGPLKMHEIQDSHSSYLLSLHKLTSSTFDVSAIHLQLEGCENKE